MSVEFDMESPGKFDSRTLNRTTLSRWTGRKLFGGADGREGANARDASKRACDPISKNNY